jgi:phosphoribosylamine--glycine ligase
MNILIVGSGGREHALAWKLAQSPLAEKLYAAPGNPGMAGIASLAAIKANDIPGLVRFSKEQGIGLVVVGPEDPLCLGLADSLREQGVPVFGPGKSGARLEGSKSFSKQFMVRHKVATARAASFTVLDEALADLKSRQAPLVIKADGLAAGKGVVIAQTLAEAERALRQMMEEKVHGAAGERVLVEDFLEGEEASLLCFCDGESLVPMASAQDHKRIGDGDTGPNTGGMGAYSPAPVLDAAAMARVQAEVLGPTLRGLKAEGMDYRGCLYVGLMLGPQGPKVVEYNCRFGDPETQAVVPRMDFDLAQVMLACAQGRGLAGMAPLKWKPEAAACVVLASAGYPGKPDSGRPILGLDQAGRALVFHAGTKLEQGRLLSAGGRVLGVVGQGRSLREAVAGAYEAVGKVHFEGMQYRRDIGHRALAAGNQGG